MRKPNKHTDQTRNFVLENYEDHPLDITLLTADSFDVTKYAVLYHIIYLIKDDLIASHGSTKDRRYEQVSIARDTFMTGISSDL